MFSFLKTHPFAVEAFFEHSIVLAFAVPKEELAAMIPPCLELDTFDDKWAFIAAAMVKTRGLRPKGLTAFLGSDFFLVGYRIFVRYTNTEGKRIRGIYIIRSETNSKMLEFSGNIFTHYSYTTTDIKELAVENQTELSSTGSNFKVIVEESEEDVKLPENSPFATWKEARRFAGPLPFTFTFDKDTNKVLIVEGVRENWTPKPIKVVSQNFGFLEGIGLKNAVLANAFIIRNVPYWWKKGRSEQWKP